MAERFRWPLCSCILNPQLAVPASRKGVEIRPGLGLFIDKAKLHHQRLLINYNADSNLYYY